MSLIDTIARWFGLEGLRPHGPAEVDERGVRRRLADGSLEEVLWDELEAVMIHTTSDGPFAEDLFWVFFGPEGQGCLVPGERAQEIGLLDVLQERLPAMDHMQVIAACGSVTEDWFEVWKSPDAEEATGTA